MPTADTTTNESRLTRDTWRRLVQTIGWFATSEVRGQAAFYFGSLLGLLVAISGLNVLNSYVGRDFMTAIEHRDHPAFVYQAFRYIAVFAASTAAAVLVRFCEERFGVLWREWLTGRLVHFYLSNRIYLQVAETDTLSNPDQRITEDVRTFVAMTLSLFLMVLNGTLTLIAFSGVLWSISPTLFLVGAIYAVVGTLLTVFLGRRLIDLNYRQADREADFRTALIEVRENAEGVALHRRERQLEGGLQERLGALVANSKRIIAVNRNLGFFTTGYNYLIQIIPALVVAPLFIRGDVEFGVITQSAMAFTALLGACSLVVTQFQTISSYAAVLARLSALAEALQPERPAADRVATVEDPDRVAYEDLTLGVIGSAEQLVRNLSFVIEPGACVLVCSDEAAARAALVRATAGVWDDGSGRVRRPDLRQIAFLPERPYLPPGTLREMLEDSDGRVPLTNELRSALVTIDALDLIELAAGTDRAFDWEHELPLRDQQLLAIARILVERPRFAFVDNLARIIGTDRLPIVLAAFVERGITCVALGGSDESWHAFETVLFVAADGTWRVESRRNEEGGAA
ncbi:MAG TPA: SbmA/BacA-like family transporter [Kofleriaceae bacterium]